MKKNSAKQYEKAINAMHQNKPSPFNPSYRPLAREAQTIAVQQLESEGMYDQIKDREVRIHIIRARYKEVLNYLENKACNNK